MERGELLKSAYFARSKLDAKLSMLQRPVYDASQSDVQTYITLHESLSQTNP
jgi:hypothetical protein